VSVVELGVAPLTCHPAWPCPVVERFEVRVRREAAGCLKVSYRLKADLSGLRVPARLAAPGRSDELWKHTCFEAFVACPDAGYREFNLAPSLAWAAYGFSGYRAGMRPLPDAVPLIEVQLTAQALTLEASLEAGCARGRLALAAVLEASDGTLSYWALRHPRPRPDFHHPENFQLEFS